MQWKWDPTISLGAVIQLGGVGLAAVGLWTYGVQFQVNTENALAAFARDRDRYVPIVDKLILNDPIQDMKIEQLQGVITEIRSTQTTTSQALQTLTTELAKIGVGVARIEERTKEKQGEK